MRLDEALECVLMGWATTDGGENQCQVGGSVQEKDCTVAEKWFGASRLQGILSTVPVHLESTAVHPSGIELP